MTHLLEACRAANFFLGLLSTGLLCYRVPQALDAVWSPRLFGVLALFVPAVALGSGVNISINLQPGPITPLFTALFLLVIWVCVRWPKEPSQLRRPA